MTRPGADTPGHASATNSVAERNPTAGIILCRSRHPGRRAAWPRRPGGRASGGTVLGRRRARGTVECECCSCRVLPGAPIFEVLTLDGELVVCGDCVGPAR
jgi:hypothetical protein